MPKIHTYAVIIDPQQENDHGMKQLVKNVSSLQHLWNVDAHVEFVPPSPNLLTGAYDLSAARSGDLIIIYGHGSSSDNMLYNYEDQALKKVNTISARELPDHLAGTLNANGSYRFVLLVCHAGYCKQMDFLTGPPFTGSFAEEFTMAAAKKNLFKGSRVWAPTGVAYREINVFGWIEYENEKKEKQVYGLKTLLGAPRENLYPDRENPYQVITI